MQKSQKVFEENIKLLQVQASRELQQEMPTPKVEQLAERKPKVRSIGGVKLTPEQWQTLEEDGFIYLEGLKKKDNDGTFSSYVFLNDEKDKAFSSKENPDGFVKYGKYEMRIRDKILIESGQITKAKVKWWGGHDFAYPYLWKEKKRDTEYKESWDDPRISKTQKEEKSREVSSIQKKSQRPKMT